MKFSEIDHESWGELRPYLDTCLIPVTGLTGQEQPYEVTGALEKLRDMMDLIEIPFKGRVVTYPSFQYGREDMANYINEVCHNVKRSGFVYVIVVSADAELGEEHFDGADIVLSPRTTAGFTEEDKKRFVYEKVEGMWRKNHEM